MKAPARSELRESRGGTELVRPRTNAELATCGIVLASGGGHNSGSGSGCFPWEFHELTAAEQGDFPDMHRRCFFFCAGFIPQYKAAGTGAILEERIIAEMDAMELIDGDSDEPTA